MGQFEPHGTQVPTVIREITFVIKSSIENEQEVEDLVAYAAVEDQNGVIAWNHQATYDELLALGLMTAQQLQTIQSFLQNFRTSVEASLIP